MDCAVALLGRFSVSEATNAHLSEKFEGSQWGLEFMRGDGKELVLLLFKLAPEPLARLIGVDRWHSLPGGLGWNRGRRYLLRCVALRRQGKIGADRRLWSMRIDRIANHLTMLADWPHLAAYAQRRPIATPQRLHARQPPSKLGAHHARRPRRRRRSILYDTLRLLCQEHIWLFGIIVVDGQKGAGEGKHINWFRINWSLNDGPRVSGLVGKRKGRKKGRSHIRKRCHGERRATRNHRFTLNPCLADNRADM